MITHVVLMKFASSSTGPEAKSRLEALLGQIPALRSLAVGLDVVRSEASYDLCLTTTHDSVEELRAYQAHPVHIDFIEWLRPLLDGRTVVDYES